MNVVGSVVFMYLGSIPPSDQNTHILGGDPPSPNSQLLGSELRLASATPDSGAGTWPSPVPIMGGQPSVHSKGFIGGQMTQVNPVIINSTTHAKEFREEECSSCRD